MKRLVIAEMAPLRMSGSWTRQAESPPPRRQAIAGALEELLGLLREQSAAEQPG